MSDSRTPVVFIHGLWLHASSWQPWLDLAAEHGYAPVAPGWPGESATVEEARRRPEAVAGFGIDDVAAHYAGIIRALDRPPVLIGHSFGGLIAQKLLGEGLARAAVAIDPAQIKGVKVLPPAQLRAGFPVLGNPANRRRAVSLTPAQFAYGSGNALSREESDDLHARFTVPSPGRPLFEAAFANFRRTSPAAVATGNAERGPLLLVSGQADHTVPDSVTRSAYKLYGDSPAVTELKQFPDRGHSLVIDHGWPVVAEYAFQWLARQGVRGQDTSYA
ncbi:alpha/beta hydrolase [Streptomyces bungoensis]